MFKTVRSKFSLVYIGLVISIALLGVFSLQTLSGITRTISGLITTNYNSITRLSSMQDALTAMDRAAVDYLYSDDQTIALEQYTQCREQFLEYYNQEQETIFLEAELVYISQIGQQFEQYHKNCSTLFTSVPSDEQSQYYRSVVRTQQRAVENCMSSLYTSNETALFARKDEAAQSASNSMYLIAVIFLITAGGGYFLATVYTRRFFAPLYALTENFKLIRQGNLDRKIKITTQDEFGMLADEFNNMVARLAEFERSTLGSVMRERNKADSLVGSIQQPLVLLDETGMIVLINQAFSLQFDLSPQQAEGMSLSELMPDSGLSQFTQTMLERGYSSSDETTIVVDKQGATLFYQIACTPIPGPDGRMSGYIMILHDITEMKQTEKMRGDYIATISHEFKTPLTSIVIGAGMLADGMTGPLTPDQREVIDTILEDSQRLEGLVDEVMELSRIESAKTIYQISSCNPHDIIETSIRQFTAIAQRNGISLTADLPDDLPAVRADFSKITWVLNNLLSNATKYTSAGDSITVSTQRKGNLLEVSVTDTGMGVPPEFVDQIFEKYVQIKGADIEIRGSGLGLAAAKEMISAHGGTIWCDPNVTKGSRFVFTLEVAEEVAE